MKPLEILGHRRRQEHSVKAVPAKLVNDYSISGMFG